MKRATRYRRASSICARHTSSLSLRRANFVPARSSCVSACRHISSAVLAARSFTKVYGVNCALSSFGNGLRRRPGLCW